MNEFLQQSSYLAVAVSLVSYGIGSWLKKRFKTGLLNPLLVSIVCTILFLFGTGISYDTYNEGAKFLTWLLTPATVSLAIPLYEQWELLKNNAKAVMAGITAGVITSLLTVLLLSMALGLSHEEVFLEDLRLCLEIDALRLLVDVVHVVEETGRSATA